jgi:hypothetical protein
MMNIPRVTSFRGSDMIDDDCRDGEQCDVCSIDRSLPAMVSPQPQVWLVVHPTSLDQVASRPFSLSTAGPLKERLSDSFIRTP